MLKCLVKVMLADGSIITYEDVYDSTIAASMDAYDRYGMEIKVRVIAVTKV